MIWRTRLALAIAACMTGAGAAHAGVVIHSTSKDLKFGREADHQTYYVENGLVRMDTKWTSQPCNRPASRRNRSWRKCHPNNAPWSKR